MVMCPSQPTAGRMASQRANYAVLLMAYGGPDSLDDVEPFLMDIREGRPTPPDLVAEIRERYARIGGKSPLLEITSMQAEALEQCLNRPDDEVETWRASVRPSYRVFIGMRHWQPRIADALAHLAAQGIHRLVALCMTPVYSAMTVGAYFAKLREAQEKLGTNLPTTPIEHWHTHPLYIEAIAEKVSAALDRFPDAARPDVQLIFSSHSLPASLIEQGDPYDTQLREIAQNVVARLEMGAKATPPLSERWHFCYQSAGARKVVWLGPPIEAVITHLSQEGHANLLVIPIGFLCDHVEILYDIDVECQELAREHGVRLERTESLNTSPTFIEALADLVRNAAGDRRR
ncbi:MAG: ferrochelatase [Chloroflexaceae bacterium]|nr:ferrochelatase [Chloroflexaceae bacterium]